MIGYVLVIFNCVMMAFDYSQISDDLFKQLERFVSYHSLN